MKIIFFLFIFFVHLTATIGLNAQDRAGIYNINFKISKRLTQITQLSSNVFYTRPTSIIVTRLSDFDKDSIKKIIERAVSTELRAQTECIYSKNRKGKDIVTIDFLKTVGGFPISTKRTAIKLHDKEYYVNVVIDFKALYRMSFMASFSGITQYRPVVSIRIIAYNEQGKPVYRKRIFVKEFEKPQGFATNINGVEIQNFQVLTAQQIREMLAKSLQELVERGK